MYSFSKVPEGKTYSRACKPGNCELPPINVIFAQKRPCRSLGKALIESAIASGKPHSSNPVPPFNLWSVARKRSLRTNSTRMEEQLRHSKAFVRELQDLVLARIGFAHRSRKAGVLLLVLTDLFR